MQILSDIDLEEGCADFRLIDKSVADILREFKENNLFIRGLIPWIGFKKFKVIYKANDRFSGSTKYSIRKMVSFAMNGITSFSIKPLRISAFLGVIVSSLAFFYSLYAIYIYFFTDRVITGWASVLISVLFMGGIQLIMLGIIGEYLGKAFIQTKGRPNYIVAEISKGLTTTT
jgi:dolichol-phosphate mannosyltransferase